MGSRARVAVLGSVNVDHVVRVAAHPAPGETVLARGFRMLPGGKGANQAVAAARYGAEVTLVGRVGADGDRYLAGLRERGVDTAAVTVSDTAPTGRAYITVDAAGENTIVVVAGANGEVADFPAEPVAAADVLVLQRELPAETVWAAARFAAERRVRVVLNASPAAEVPDDVLALADPVVVNEHEAAALPDAARSVCVTLGAAGARWGAVTIGAPVVDVLDTTGAGDCFAGTLAAALATGLPDGEALGAAVAAGARATTWDGAQGWEL